MNTEEYLISYERKSEESDYSAKIKIYEETAKRLSEKLKKFIKELKQYLTTF